MSENETHNEKFDLELEIRDSYIFALPSGTISEFSLIQLAKVLAKKCEEAGTECVLIDCSKYLGALNVTQLYYVSQRFAEVIGHDKKVAYINPPDHWIQEVDEFSRNVVNTRGGNLELFESEEKALEWFKYMTYKQ